MWRPMCFMRLYADWFRRGVLWSAISIGILLVPVGCGSAQHAMSGPADAVVAHELLVTFAGDVERGESIRRLQENGAEIVRAYEHMPVFHVRAPAGMSLDEALARFGQIPGVIAAEPNRRRRP